MSWMYKYCQLFTVCCPYCKKTVSLWASSHLWWYKQSRRLNEARVGERSEAVRFSYLARPLTGLLPLLTYLSRLCSLNLLLSQHMRTRSQAKICRTWYAKRDILLKTLQCTFLARCCLRTALSAANSFAAVTHWGHVLVIRSRIQRRLSLFKVLMKLLSKSSLIVASWEDKNCYN